VCRAYARGAGGGGEAAVKRMIAGTLVASLKRSLRWFRSCNIFARVLCTKIPPPRAPLEPWLDTCSTLRHQISTLPRHYPDTPTLRHQCQSTLGPTLRHQCQASVKPS